MSSSRSFPLGWAAGILLVLSVGLAGWAFNQRRHIQAEMAAATQAQSLLDSSIQHTQAAIDREKKAETAMIEQQKRAQAAAVAAQEAKLKAARPDFDAILSAHPELLAMYVKAIRGYLGQTYGSAFARLHLSADQIDRMETLIVNDLENQMDLNAAAQSQGLTQDDPAMVKAREQQVADLHAAEQSLLGPEAYGAFDAASRAEALRGTVEQVAAMTTMSATPLTGEQSEQLVQLMAQSSSDYRDGKKATASTVDWDTVLAQAPTFLAPSQVAALQGMAQLNRFQALVKGYAAQQAPAQ